MKIDRINAITPDTAGTILGAIKTRGTKLIKFGKKKLTIEQVLKQYDPNLHDVQDPSLRRDKTIKVPAPDSNDNDDSENEKLVTEIVKVNRVSTSAQRLIVKRHVAFLTGTPMDYIATPNGDTEETFLKALRRVNENVKMDYLNTQIGEMMCSETHCAELWYVVDNTVEGSEDVQNDFEGINIDTRGLTLRCKLIGHSLGDSLYPVWDGTGNMIAFLRVYKDYNDDDVEIEISELYTKDVTFIIKRSPTAGNAYTVEAKENVIGKIPVIYYTQDAPEWFDVQSSIARYEKLISNLGDSNDYYASPTTVINGKVVGFNRKGEAGKILEVGKDANVTLLEAKNGVESVKFEKETLKSEILEGSQTPDISFDSMKGLGTFSGIALKMLFFDASLKVKGKLPTYGMSKQRSINFQKAALATFDLSFKQAALMPVKPKIEAYLPQNTEELINMLALSTNNQPTMSQETAVSLNPLVDNATEEAAKVAADAKRIADAQVTTF